MTRRYRLLFSALVLALGCDALSAADPRGGPSIYTCTHRDGKKTTSDRPAACDGDQRELNADGSTRRNLPPLLSPEELANLDQANREKENKDKERRELARRDSLLVKKFRDEGEHRRARTAALEEIKASIANNEKRIEILRVERKKIDEELEFYQPPKKPPPKLRAQADANEAAMAAQRQLIQNLEAEFVRING
ncbi:MAG: hypothetical protein M3Z16_07120, partial [Pseudomonadota bacterium]|nr:hypothetical protein [Pseudomonadota bacterium]